MMGIGDSSDYSILDLGSRRIRVDPSDMRTPEAVFQLYPNVGYSATCIRVG
jgi:hypothetical protein